MSLKYYSKSEDTRKEELNNQSYVGREVWIRAEISEVADPMSGFVLIAVSNYSEEGEEKDYEELAVPVDSDDLKFLNDEDQLVDD